MRISSRTWGRELTDSVPVSQHRKKIPSRKKKKKKEKRKQSSTVRVMRTTGVEGAGSGTG